MHEREKASLACIGPLALAGAILATTGNPSASGTVGLGRDVPSQFLSRGQSEPENTGSLSGAGIVTVLAKVCVQV